MALLSINNSDNSIVTLTPQGGELKFLETTDELKKNRIGEFKRIVLEFDVGEDTINSHQIYFVPALFMETSAPNPMIPLVPSNNYWAYTVDASATAGIYPMYLSCSIGYAADLLKNYNVTIEIKTANSYAITIEYYHLADNLQFLNPSIENNQAKLLKDRINNPLILSPSPNSIYDSPKLKPRFYLYEKHPTDVTTYGYLDIQLENYQAGFYNYNELQTAPYFTLPVFRLERDSAPVPNLVLSGDTLVHFQVTAPATVTNMMLWMIRSNKTDQTVDFKANYDASFIQVLTNYGPATLDNKFIAPSLAPNNTSGSLWECSVTIDRTKLAVGEKYRFIGIAYEDTEELYEVNSFISGEYEVTESKYVGAFDPTGKLTDYLRNFTGNDLVCVVEERIKSTMSFDLTGDKFTDDISNRLGLTVSNDLRRYLNKITIEIYEDIGMTRHYFDRVICNKTAPYTFSAASGLTISAPTDHFNAEYLFRVRYEAGAQNLQTTIGGITLPTPTANQNWAGRDLRIQWTFELYYDDYTTPLYDQIVFTQKLHPKDYDATTDMYITYENGSIIDDNDYFCNTETKCFNCHLDDSDGYKLITTIERSPGSISSIEEKEVYTMGVLLQKTTNKITDQEEIFSQTEENAAKFCIDGSKLFVDSLYKICAIAKKNSLYKQFEDGDIFEFEDGEFYDFEN